MVKKMEVDGRWKDGEERERERNKSERQVRGVLDTKI